VLDRNVYAAVRPRPLAPEVARALDAQNGRLPPSRARDEHLAALRRGAAAVVTGQQLGLFLGPLYTLYKAATAVRAARALAADTGVPVVPVFWLQSEDHDLVEIAACAWPGDDGGVRAVGLPASADDRISVAHLTLPPAIDRCLAELRAALGAHPHAEEHLARLARHYRAGAGWGAAFAGVMAELFADEGLVFVDPRDPALASVARPVHRKAIVDAERIAAALIARSESLDRAPVHVRPGAPLGFFHERGAAGPRARVDAPFDAHALLARLDEDPLCFSTSALLRPILQDTMLPTAAYVGGPAEVAYLRQIAPLYELYGLPQPAVIPRASFRIIDRRTARLLDRLGLAPDDAERPEDELLGRVRQGDRIAADDVARRLLAGYDAAQAEVAPAVRAAGADLPRALERTRRQVERSIGRLARKVGRALLRRDDELVARVRRLKTNLWPNGVPQERVFGLPWYAARIGDRALVERVLAAIDPFDPTPRDLRA
jgi:bacillithiol biosynthesis cysteine-adding enzyme BshC